MRTWHVNLAFAGITSVLTILAACKGGGGTLPTPDDDGDDSTQQPPVPTATGTGTGTAPTGTTTSTPTATVRASQFAQDCAGDGDCVVVYQGLICTPCPCANDAIATKDKGKYDSEVAKTQPQCPKLEVACAPCQSPVAKCTNNRCTAVNP